MCLRAGSIARVATMVSLAACIGEQVSTAPETPEQTTGRAEILVSTTGSNLDPDGYLVTLDESRNERVGTHGMVTFSLLQPGGYTVELSDVAGNCAVPSGSVRSFSVTPSSLTTISFEVACT